MTSQMMLVAVAVLTCFVFYSNGDLLAQRYNKNSFTNTLGKMMKRSAESVSSEKTCLIEQPEIKYYKGQCIALANGQKACMGEGYMDPMTTQCDNDA